MCVPVKENQVMGSFQDLQDLATARNEVRLTSYGQYLNTGPCGSLFLDSARCGAPVSYSSNFDIPP